MSEVARLLRQIELEYEAAKRGLEEYAVISRHAFISARYEKVDGYQKQLMVLLGEEQATEVVCTLYDAVFDGKKS
ncbi:MAG: hypothetical protein ACJ788_12715 [Ktedonobacteraceae bacterium]|jgi:hypothetical protein